MGIELERAVELWRMCADIMVIQKLTILFISLWISLSDSAPGRVDILIAYMEWSI